MDFGTSDIQDIIYRQLEAAKANIPGGRPKFAKDTAKKIYEMVEGSLKNKQWNVAHGFSQDAEKVVLRLEKGLGFNLMQRTPEAAVVYEWIIEQEANGYSLDRWMRWATEPDRAKYAGKYRSDPRHIQADWPQAFIPSDTMQGPVWFK